MDLNESRSPFIFYLTLEENLSSTFYAFDKHFKDLGYILVPVYVDQLQSLVSLTEQEHVVVLSSVTDSREFKTYNEKVRGVLKYLLRSRRITFMHLSSFNKINDSTLYKLSKNYFFLRYPVNAKELAWKICRYQKLKSEQSTAWPGGKRAGLGMMAV